MTALTSLIATSSPVCTLTAETNKSIENQIITQTKQGCYLLMLPKQ
jgi:hypothetical protein